MKAKKAEPAADAAEQWLKDDASLLFDEIREGLAEVRATIGESEIALEICLETLAMAQDDYARGDYRGAVMKTWIAGDFSKLTARIEDGSQAKKDAGKTLQQKKKRQREGAKTQIRQAWNRATNLGLIGGMSSSEQADYLSTHNKAACAGIDRASLGSYVREFLREYKKRSKNAR